MADETEKEVEFSKGKKGGAKSKFANFATFIWNGETSEFLGRTGKSWALIGVYYAIFYSCLAGFFTINLLVFFTGISDTEPKLQGYNTLLKGHPGMGFRPMANDDNTLISFKQGQNDTNNLQKIIKNLDDFLLPYENQTNNDVYMDCSENKNATKDKLCRFDLKQFKDCSKDKAYGYMTGQPCVFLKLNKIYGWLPEQWSYNNDTCSKENCPENPIAPGHIGVTCEGESDADKDFILDIKFYPESGFSSQYYPYLNQKGYLAPLVAVQFKVKPGALVMIWCKAWANNIYHHKNDRAGSVHFELLVD